MRLCSPGRLHFREIGLDAFSPLLFKSLVGTLLAVTGEYNLMNKFIFYYANFIVSFPSRFPSAPYHLSYNVTLPSTSWCGRVVPECGCSGASRNVDGKEITEIKETLFIRVCAPGTVIPNVLSLSIFWPGFVVDYAAESEDALPATLIPNVLPLSMFWPGFVVNSVTESDDALFYVRDILHHSPDE